MSINNKKINHQLQNQIKITKNQSPIKISITYHNNKSTITKKTQSEKSITNYKNQ